MSQRAVRRLPASSPCLAVLATGIVIMLAVSPRAVRAEEPPLAERYLLDGRLAEGITALEARLASLGASWHGVSEQVDRYFNHPSRDFTVTDEALRLRSTPAGVAVTWKGPRLDTTAKTRREIELPLVESAVPAAEMVESAVPAAEVVASAVAAAVEAQARGRRGAAAGAARHRRRR